MKRRYAITVIVTVIYIVFAVWNIREYNIYIKSELKKYPESIRPYIDIFFTETWYGKATLILGLLIALIDIISISTFIRYTHK